MNKQAGGDIILYQRGDAPAIDVRLDGDTVWLSQQQLADLFQTSRTNVVEHIANIYAEGELSQEATCREFRQVRTEGTRQVNRTLPFYNLDLIISLGYRVKSAIATQFRIWATERLRELDTILSSAGRKLLNHAGTVSHLQAENKARLELQKYKAKTLATVEKDYLQAITDLDKQAKKAARENGGKA